MQNKADSPSQSILKTDAGKTKSNAIEVPSITLPKGGGAIKGIDEKFSVNAVNGTASFSIPLPVAAARGAVPALSLSYNSGSGNGIFGLGWNLSLPSIKRKTDKALPRYADSIDSDTFLFSEAEDLVPEFKKENGNWVLDEDGDYTFNERPSADNKYIIRYYKPRIEGLFAKIERWTHKTSGEIKWRVISKENITTLFGWSSVSRISDPDNDNRIYEWLPEFVFDDKGNCCYYVYVKENSTGIDETKIHNRNRIKNGSITYTNRYLSKMLYGNKTPYRKFGNEYPGESDFLFETVFDYGSLGDNENPATLNNWNYRTDAFSDYKAGFEIRTTRLCKRVLLFHHFKDDEYDGLVKSLNFNYDTTGEEDFTFLQSITSVGYIKKTDGSYSSRSLPAMEFAYQKHEWSKAIKTIAAEDIIHAPAGLDEQQYQFTDLFNEGLSGILTEQANGWYYKHNLGNGIFEPAKLVNPKPSFAGLGAQLQLADLDADGGKQLVSYNTDPKGYFELNDDNQWLPFKNFNTLPNIPFNDANTKMLDLNGDGKAELLISEENVFTWYASKGREGFTAAVKTTKPFDEEAGPAIVFADSNQTIFLASMSGSGLSDIVRIRNGEVCYWPNLGYGNFGAKVAMDNAPVFDHPDAFNPSYLRLADIDGSGTTDIIYLGKNKFTCWLNLSGNSFSTRPFEIDAFPQIHHQAKITITDLLGNGVACIVWSSILNKDAQAPLCYIDLMQSRKPHIMIAYKNNMGKEVNFDYKPSTHFYIQDKLAGKPWVTKLHFPVHCIAKTELIDKITGHHFVSTYKYHHGYYDHAEKEFRGFGMVEQTDAEHFEHWVKSGASNIVDAELHQEPVTAKSWHHTGAFLRADKILSQFEQDYWQNEMTKNKFAFTDQEHKLPDAIVIDDKGNRLTRLTTQEWQEAARACKGMVLRNEVFAGDIDLQTALTPYSVATHNCIIEMLQPQGKNKHAIFVVKESEAITYSYERNTEDPRIGHNINLKLDEYGNVLESASIVYPRLIADTSLPIETQQEQNKTIIIYTQNKFTNDVNADDVWRMRLPGEVKTFELSNIPTADPFYYKASDFEAVLTAANEIPYHDLTLPATKTKRLTEHVKTTYYKNSLTGSLPLNTLESLALPYESYQLAYTPELLEDIFSEKVPLASDRENLMFEGEYTHALDEVGNEDVNWWVRSGTTQFIKAGESATDAENRFYVPVSYTDPYGAITKVDYNTAYYLYIQKAEDAVGNITSVAKFNYRTLSPQLMMDANDNLSEVITDELGLVKAMAVMGKGNEADDLTGLEEYSDPAEQTYINNFLNASNTDGLRGNGKNLLKHATARFVYDFDVYKSTGKPTVVASILREEHYVKNNDASIQLSFEYSNGVGQVAMKKVQTTPGDAKKVTLTTDDTVTITTENTGSQLRWIGNGKTILNNKGNPVKQYEPYFSATHQYEDYKELVETGVTPIMYYDALGRLIKTEMPDGSFTRVAFDSWKQVIYDANDTVKISDWYKRRTISTRPDYISDPKEQQAAFKAAAHADTPVVQHFNTLGKPILSVENNGLAGSYNTKVFLDTEGNLRKVIDARENTVMQYKYDMLGNLVYQNSMDAGQRWLLHNVLGNPLRTWDDRNHTFIYRYDPLHRPAESIVTRGDGDVALNNVFDKIIYGEGISIGSKTDKELNLRGQAYQHYDTGGLLEMPEYDFSGKPITTHRTLFKHYTQVADWTTINPIDLETDIFTFTTYTDALGRISQQTAPDGSVIYPEYSEAGVLQRESVKHADATDAAYYIEDIEYNEKGQRSKIRYGNNVLTRFTYDAETFRLKEIRTTKDNGSTILQHLLHTYDPAGNITCIEDLAIPAQFYAGRIIEAKSEYTYDALYRLIEATGRENKSPMIVGGKDNWNDAPYMQPISATAIWNYKQIYTYDEVGNIRTMIHQNDNPLVPAWTRTYDYQTANNRLISTGGQGNLYNYTHHTQHGFITALPHLQEMGWNFKEELIKTIRQKQNSGTPETTYYQYDGQGQRIRKITENSADAGQIPTKKDERIYIAGYETYRTYAANTKDFERTSLSLLEEDHRFVMVETITLNTDPVPSPSELVGTRLVRYQLHNHLGSAALELDDIARIINYEEYHPFGTTAYQASNANINAAAKRYRYTGMERDEETGLEYHSARYYLPWLGRWLNTDPIGIGDGVNVYGYCKGNPFISTDKDGKQANEEINTMLATSTTNSGIGSQTQKNTKYKPFPLVDISHINENIALKNGNVATIDDKKRNWFTTSTTTKSSDYKSLFSVPTFNLNYSNDSLPEKNLKVEEKNLYLIKFSNENSDFLFFIQAEGELTGSLELKFGVDSENFDAYIKTGFQLKGTFRLDKNGGTGDANMAYTFDAKAGVKVGSYSSSTDFHYEKILKTTNPENNNSLAYSISKNNKFSLTKKELSRKSDFTESKLKAEASVNISPVSFNEKGELSVIFQIGGEFEDSEEIPLYKPAFLSLVISGKGSVSAIGKLLVVPRNPTSQFLK